MSLTRPFMSRGCPLLSLSGALAVTICPINQVLNFSQSALAQSFREKGDKWQVAGGKAQRQAED